MSIVRRSSGFTNVFNNLQIDEEVEREPASTVFYAYYSLRRLQRMNKRDQEYYWTSNCVDSAFLHDMTV